MRTAVVVLRGRNRGQVGTIAGTLADHAKRRSRFGGDPDKYKVIVVFNHLLFPRDACYKFMRDIIEADRELFA